jgi:mRNA-degrading endonuclease RelE of RelBE toxin-antitoxin system
VEVLVLPDVYEDMEAIAVGDCRLIIEALENLKKLKSLSESVHLKKMKGTKHIFRYRVGSYRILLKWDKQTQILTAEGVIHRQSVYKKWKLKS